MKDFQPCLYVVVPVFNETDNLRGLIKSFREIEAGYKDSYNSCFILIDDGSIDNTVSIARQLASGLNLVTLAHQNNRGPGSAFATAFEYLAGILREDDWVVTMEGDNTSRHELLRQMFIRTKEGFDVILASPYLYGGRITKTSSIRIIISHIANAFVKELLGLHGIVTISSFYRLYRGAALKKLQSYYGKRIIQRRGFESMIEILLKMTNLKIAISEVPMHLDTSLRKGKSKMKVMGTILGYLTLWKDKKRWSVPVSGR